MKKLVLFIVIFTILAIGCTSIMIKIKNNDENVGNIFNEGIINNKEDIQEEITEKTLNLKGTYSQNDLLIVESDFFIEEQDMTIKIPQISGLKNKDVEEKINSNIKKQFDKNLKKIVLENEIVELTCDYDIMANYSNVLSISANVSDYHIEMYRCFYLNYNLIDGNELKFEDLFKKDENLKAIVRTALYRGLVLRQSGETFYNDDYEPYYDSNDGVWYVKKYWIDEEGIEHNDIEEYVPPMSEYEIEKNAEKFLNSTEKKFYFSTSDFVIEIDENLYYAYFYDMPEKIVIYNKYLTKESLYENENINSKSFVACSEESNLGNYKKTKYETENFFYDMNILTTEAEGYPARKFVDLQVENQIEEINKKIKEYKEIAQENPDKAYFLFIESELYNANNTSTKYNPDLGYYEETIKPMNIFITDLETKLIVCDIEEKESVLEKLLSVYRYYNLRMYGDAIDCIYEGELVSGKTLDLPIVWDIVRKSYDVLTGNEIKSVKEIFKNDVDYIDVIENTSLNTFNRDIDNSSEIELTKEGMAVQANDNGDPYFLVYYSEIEDYLKVKEIKSEILPSSTRLIEKQELENMNEDELNKAYNEMFARHGHDFKNQEYKYYFSLWDWYEPVEGKTVSIDEFNEIEKYNFNLIKTEIEERY